MAALTHYMGVAPISDTSVTYRARTDSAATIKARYSTASDLSGYTLSSGVSVVSGNDFTGGETLTGLFADTEYYLGIEVDGALAHSSPYTRFKTPPATSYTGSIVVATGSCQNSPDNANLFPAMLSSGARLLIHLGDFGYPDTTVLADQRTSYQAQYASHFQSSIADRMLRLHMWDDHDYGGNNEDGLLANKANSLQAFKEYVPTPTLWDGTNHLGYDIRFGYVHFFVPDLRYQRYPHGGERYPDTFPFTSATVQAGSGGTTLVLPNDANPFNTFYNGWYVSLTTGSGTYTARVSSYTGATRTATLDTSILSLTSGDTCYLKRASMMDMDIVGANNQVTRLIDGMNDTTAIWKVWCSTVPLSRTLAADDVWGGYDTEYLEQRYILERIAGVSNKLGFSGDRHFFALDDGTNSVMPEMMAGPFNETSFSAQGTWSHGTHGSGNNFGLATFTRSQVTLEGKNNTGGAASGVTSLVIPATGLLRIPWLRA